MDRVDPYQDTVSAKELLAHLVGELLIVNGGLGMNANCRQLFENAVETIVMRYRVAPRFAIAAP
jgi:hypothetical protein